MTSNSEDLSRAIITFRASFLMMIMCNLATNAHSVGLNDSNPMERQLFHWAVYLVYHIFFLRGYSFLNFTMKIS